MQAYSKDKYYDFVLASDINANCELTHKVRYNHQLGLDTKFLTEDIMSDSFVSDLKKAIGGKEIDVVTGGPSCQSFSLSGRRRKYDKRDNLFEHYLKVIEALRPKYFVMENVKGLLTKDKGKFKERIVSRILSIIDSEKKDKLYKFVHDEPMAGKSSLFMRCIDAKLHFEIEDDNQSQKYVDAFFSAIDELFKDLTRNIDYRTSKTDIDINTIRHGINLLKHYNERLKIMGSIIQEKASSNIDNDSFVDGINDFISSMEDDSIIEKIGTALRGASSLKGQQDKVEEFEYLLKLYAMDLNEVLDEVKACLPEERKKDFDTLLDEVRLYRISKPMVLLSADYGVPQNRERVVFIGCRNDQKLISEIPATVDKNDRVTVYEAISDLDFIGDGESRTSYEKAKPIKEYEPLVKERLVDGAEQPQGEKHKFAEWSKMGRLSHRFTFDTEPFYVRNDEELQHPETYVKQELFNHQTSSQNDTVKARLAVIAKHGEYDDSCKEELKKLGLESNKRNYTVLKPTKQSPTVVTMPDDFIHYSKNRPLTVREMARLQSFDDSFVFQGKRQTGGDNRKSEIPQYTLVGNAVPPLMSRAIGNAILKVIK